MGNSFVISASVQFDRKEVTVEFGTPVTSTINSDSYPWKVVKVYSDQLVVVQRTGLLNTFAIIRPDKKGRKAGEWYEVDDTSKTTEFTFGEAIDYQAREY